MLALARGVPNELVSAAATPAGQLRLLASFASAHLRDSLAEHFGYLVSLARRTMADEVGADVVSIVRARTRKTQLRMQLSLAGFFSTWFGPLSDKANGAGEAHVAGWDLDHPILRFGSRSLEHLAEDLVHIGAWHHVEANFDRLAYLNLAEVVRLRDPHGQDSGLPASFRSLGRILGASGEAVRRTYLYATSTEGGPPRRDRRLPGREEALRCFRVQTDAAGGAA